LTTDVLIRYKIQAQRFGGAGETVNRLRQFHDRNLMRAPYIDDLVVRCLALQGPQDPGDRVGDKGETAGLQAVAVDRDDLAVKNRIDENRLRSTPPAQVLPRTVGPENPANRDRNTILFMEANCQVLVEELGAGIRPARDR